MHAAVGSSLGGMLSLMTGCMYPDRVHRVVSISACAQSHPTSIAMRYVQRRILMSDQHWNKGFYYNGSFPRLGMKHARLVSSFRDPSKSIDVEWIFDLLFIAKSKGLSLS